jgi:hypothetical protein
VTFWEADYRGRLAELSQLNWSSWVSSSVKLAFLVGMVTGPSRCESRNIIARLALCLTPRKNDHEIDCGGTRERRQRVVGQIAAKALAVGESSRESSCCAPSVGERE